MQEVNVPLCLNDAREEVLIALTLADGEAADLHMRRARHFMTKAVRALQRDPERRNDWSLLGAPKR